MRSPVGRMEFLSAVGSAPSSSRCCQGSRTGSGRSYQIERASGVRGWSAVVRVVVKAMSVVEALALRPVFAGTRAAWKTRPLSWPIRLATVGPAGTRPSACSEGRANRDDCVHGRGRKWPSGTRMPLRGPGYAAARRATGATRGSVVSGAHFEAPVGDRSAGGIALRVLHLRILANQSNWRCGECQWGAVATARAGSSQNVATRTAVTWRQSAS